MIIILFQVYEKLDSDVQTVIPGLDFLVYVQVYDPFNSSMLRIGKSFKHSLPILRIKSVISILGCQYLTELREKIMCISDLSVATEISEDPDQWPKMMAKVLFQFRVSYSFLYSIIII